MGGQAGACEKQEQLWEKGPLWLSPGINSYKVEVTIQTTEECVRHALGNATSKIQLRECLKDKSGSFPPWGACSLQPSISRQF